MIFCDIKLSLHYSRPSLSNILDAFVNVPHGSEIVPTTVDNTFQNCGNENSLAGLQRLYDIHGVSFKTIV